MKQGFSLGMDVIVDEEGQYDASISYLDTDDNEITANAKGETIEDVCLNLYDKLTDKIAALEEDNSPEDMTDEEYIAYLEEEIERLRNKEKNDNVISKENLLKELGKIYDYNDYYNKLYKSLKKSSPFFKYSFTW